MGRLSHSARMEACDSSYKWLYISFEKLVLHAQADLGPFEDSKRPASISSLTKYLHPASDQIQTLDPSLLWSEIGQKSFFGRAGNSPCISFPLWVK